MLLHQFLCADCEEDKNKAFVEGQGLTWVAKDYKMANYALLTPLPSEDWSELPKYATYKGSFKDGLSFITLIMLGARFLQEAKDMWTRAEQMAREWYATRHSRGA